MLSDCQHSDEMPFPAREFKAIRRQIHAVYRLPYRIQTEYLTELLRWYIGVMSLRRHCSEGDQSQLLVDHCLPGPHGHPSDTTR